VQACAPVFRQASLRSTRLTHWLASSQRHPAGSGRLFCRWHPADSQQCLVVPDQACRRIAQVEGFFRPAAGGSG